MITHQLYELGSRAAHKNSMEINKGRGERRMNDGDWGREIGAERKVNDQPTQCKESNQPPNNQNKQYILEEPKQQQPSRQQRSYEQTQQEKHIKYFLFYV